MKHSPRVIQISADKVLPRVELLARVAGLARFPKAVRSRYAVQLRDPELSTRELVRWGRELREATRAVGAMLLVNDRADLALGLEADGLHLGRHSLRPADARRLLGPHAWISCSCHNLHELEEALSGDVDGALLSPIYATAGKGEPLGLGFLRTAREAVKPEQRTTLFALGGVNEARAADCLAAGADAVAAIRADLSGLLGA